MLTFPGHLSPEALLVGEVLLARGLPPPRVCSPAEQERRVMGNLRAKESDLERYIALISLQDRNETLFYQVVVNHIEEIMPLIYTPAVGKACQQFSHIYRRPRGLYISLQDRGRVREILDNWPHRDPRIIIFPRGGSTPACPISARYRP